MVYIPLSIKIIIMPETNGIDAMAKYAERIIKVRVPIESDEDPLKIFEEISRKHGRKLTMEEIERTLEDRYGP